MQNNAKKYQSAHGHEENLPEELLSFFKRTLKTYSLSLTYKIGVGEGTFAIHLLVSEIAPTKKMIDSKQQIVTLIGP
jgi:hypothetical protein